MANGLSPVFSLSIQARHGKSNIHCSYSQWIFKNVLNTTVEKQANQVHKLFEKVCGLCPPSLLTLTSCCPLHSAPLPQTSWLPAAGIGTCPPTFSWPAAGCGQISSRKWTKKGEKNTFAMSSWERKCKIKWTHRHWHPWMFYFMEHLGKNVLETSRKSRNTNISRW